jgi:hypothetical protein
MLEIYREVYFINLRFVSHTDFASLTSLPKKKCQAYNKAPGICKIQSEDFYLICRLR